MKKRININDQIVKLQFYFALYSVIFWWKLREKISVPSLIKVGNAKILL